MTLIRQSGSDNAPCCQHGPPHLNWWGDGKGSTLSEWIYQRFGKNGVTEIIVEPVTTGKQWRQFLNLPWELHQQDPCWVPPLRLTQEEMVGFQKHAFYENADRQAFVALREGKPVGRILALVNHAHNQRYKENRGFVGFFESLADTRVSRSLFDAARDWLSLRNQDSMRGPMNPSMNYECGLLVEGFDSPATFMMSYNPSYYPELWKEYGWVKSHDMFAYRADTSMLHLVEGKIASIMEAAKERFNVKTRPADKRRFDQDVLHFLRIYNAAMVSSWGFIPFSDNEIKQLAGSLKHLIVPELTSCAEVDGEVVGVAFAIPDLNPLIKKIDGRLFPFGFLRLLFGKKSLKRVRLVSTNVMPEYQRWGLGLVVLAEILPRALAMGIKEAEFSWVLESNDLSRKTIEKGGAIRTNTYRVYDLTIRRDHNSGVVTSK